MNYMDIARDLANDTEKLKELRATDRKTYGKVKAAVENEAKSSGIVSRTASRILAPSEIRALPTYQIDNEGLGEKVYPEVELSRMPSPDRFLAELNYEQPLEKINEQIARYAESYSKAGGKVNASSLRERAVLNRNQHIDAHYETLDDLYERNVSRNDAADDARSEAYREPAPQKVELLDDTMEPDYEPTL